MKTILMISAPSVRFQILHTKPSLKDILHTSIKLLLEKASTPQMSTLPDEIKTIIQLNNLGWQQLFNGRIISAWLSI
eukprot:2464305-Ditylum_brightwellii.AAC.1